ncbi:MAG: hypothetical protein CSA96_07005 [Bacteroidetes bacterium]|nr:MAG: hypothetical protein CSA96_07005 [Bacteroidota bacterium]
MKKVYLMALGLVLMALSVQAQSILSPREDFKAAEMLPNYLINGAIDLNDTCLVIQNADSIVIVDTRDGRELGKFFEPTDYEAKHFISFVALSPDGKSLWTGFTTTGFTDDRIYQVDLSDGSWTQKAAFQANYDLEFWNDQILVSGTNNAEFGAPSGIYLLDLSGNNQHRELIKIGGYSTGMSVDQMGDLYCGTSYSMDPNVLVQWDSVALSAVINDTDALPLDLDDAVKLSDLPAGAGDCAVDANGDVFVNLNIWGGSNQALTRWNGTAGDGIQLDTLATSASWLMSIETRGSFAEPSPGNAVYTYAGGTPLNELHMDYLPIVANPMADIDLTDPSADSLLALAGVFSDPDDPDEDIDCSVLSNSDESLVTASISNDTLHLSFATERSGNACIVVEAQSNGKMVNDTIMISLTSTVGMDVNSLTHIKLYPNPARELLYVRSAGDRASVKLYNLQGTCLRSIDLKGSEASLDISALKPGSYLILVESAGEVHRQLIQKL